MASTGGNQSYMSVGDKARRHVGSESPASSSSSHRKHHRRIAAEDSVSLRHGKYSSSAAEPHKTFTIPPKLRHGGSPSGVSSRPIPPKHHRSNDSGFGGDAIFTNNADKVSVIESNSSNDRSIPEDWFKSWNNNAGELNKPMPVDGDSPYYLPSDLQRRKLNTRNHGSNTQTTSSLNRETKYGHQAEDQLQLNPMNPNYTSVLPTQDSDSESDIYRSVIDDLTVKNKKLKKKLQKLERLHCKELDEEKLFEVRCYGLPPARKQELQELLQRFAADLDGGPNVYQNKRSDAISTANATSSTNPSSSSLVQNTDSAYATETTRLTSLDGASTMDISKTTSKKSNPLPGAARGSFSASTEDQHPEFANERTKMKLVVRRLEQIFTGRDALRSDIEKTQIQQEIAVAASQEKRASVNNDLEDSGDEEDKREASLMSMQQDDDLLRDRDQEPRYKPSIDPSHQRPTRPKDLDLSRALVATDNVGYLEHMSYSSSRKHHLKTPILGESSEWVYLNLIINMAQIHTLNVSLPFIKKAIRTLSDKIDLSSDGNKVRWRGGTSETRLNSDSDGVTSSGNENSSAGESSPENPSAGGISNKQTSNETKSKPSVSRSNLGAKSRSRSMASPHNKQTGDSRANDAFRYKPLLFHKVASKGSDSKTTSDSDSSDSESEADSNPSGAPPPMLESGINISLLDLGKFAPVDGPIIYFGGAPFCTDLSAQIVFRDGGHTFLGNTQTRNYERLTEEPVGKSSSQDISSNFDKNERPLHSMDWNAQDVEMDTVDDTSTETLPQLTSIIEATPESPRSLPSPIPFDVSGLGGIRPEDNFVLHVKTRQAPVSSRARIHKRRSIHHNIPSKSLQAFFEERRFPRNEQLASNPTLFESSVTDVTSIRLLPSKVPGPTFALSLSEGSTDPFLSTSDEPRSYESHISFDFPSSGDGALPSFHSPDLDDQSAMDLDPEEDFFAGENPLAPLSVVATAGDCSDDESVASHKDMPIVQPMDEMDLGGVMEMRVEA